MTITIKYSCHGCGLVDIELAVPARENEDIIEWTQNTAKHITADHIKRSPKCYSDRISEIKVPVAHTNKIGGPELQ